MPLKMIQQFELSCDDGVSAICRARQSGNQGIAAVTAYSEKGALAIVRKSGWKVNDGRRGKPPTFVCPECQRQNAANGGRKKPAPGKVARSAGPMARR